MNSFFIIVVTILVTHLTPYSCDEPPYGSEYCYKPTKTEIETQYEITETVQEAKEHKKRIFDMYNNWNITKPIWRTFDDDCMYKDIESIQIYKVKGDDLKDRCKEMKTTPEGIETPKRAENAKPEQLCYDITCPIHKKHYEEQTIPCCLTHNCWVFNDGTRHSNAFLKNHDCKKIIADFKRGNNN